MTDILERLRDGGVFPMTFGGPDVKDVAILYDPMAATDAIKDIERLRTDNERLRAALEAIDTNLNVWSPHPAGSVQATMRDIARAALEGKDE